MALPTINATQPEQAAPGTNPNRRIKDKGLMGEYSKTMLSQMADNISPSNFIRQGTYGAFGNNALTRTAMGAMDATGGMIDKFLGINSDDENDTATDKLLKDQIKLLTKTNEEIDATNKILKELLEVEKTKIQEVEKKPKSEPNETEVEKIPKKKKPKIRPNDFAEVLAPKNVDHQLEHDDGKSSIMESINSNLVDISGILTNGFDKLERSLSGRGEERGIPGRKRRRKIGNVEDATIVSETHFGDSIKKEKALQKKYQIDSIKFLKRISTGIDKIYEILTKGNDLLSDENNAESNRKEKFMGKADEVTDAKEVPKLTMEEVGGGGLMGAVSALVAELMLNMKSVTGKIAELFKAGMEKFKGALETAWEFGKKTVSETFSWIKKKGGTLVEGAEKMAGEVGEKIAGKGGIKAIAKKGLGKALKFIPGVGEIAMVGMAGYEAYDASQNAEEILDIKGRKATTGEKVEAGIGGAVESLSFGLIGKEKTARWIDGLMTDKKDNQDKLNEKQEELNQQNKDRAVSPSDAVGAPSVSVNNTSNSYFGNRKQARNDDVSYNRYLDRHYAF